MAGHIKVSAWDGLVIDTSVPRFTVVGGFIRDRVVGARYDIASFAEFARQFLPEIMNEVDVPGWPGGPSVPDPNVHGPFMDTAVAYWINSRTYRVGYNLDNDADPDVWLTPLQVMQSDIAMEDKAKIMARLMEYGYQPTPRIQDMMDAGMTAEGK